jgi:pyrimidine operon attenuation protein/uracil phosphoribosyltransferase
MVGFILGISIAFNLVFVGIWVYGIMIQKRIKKDVKKILGSTKLPTEFYKDWMYEA